MRHGEKYSLDEVLFYIDGLSKDKDIDTLSKFAKRSTKAAKSKLDKVFGDKKTEIDGPQSMKGLLQYDSLSEIYESFGERLPSGDLGDEDFNKRVANFRKYMGGQR